MLVYVSQTSLQAQAFLMQAVEDSQAASTKDSVLKSLEEGPQQLLREAPASQPLLSLQAHSLIRLNRQATSRTASNLASALSISRMFLPSMWSTCPLALLRVRFRICSSSGG